MWSDNIEDTSCPSKKTSNWRYAIMTFPTVDIIFNYNKIWLIRI